MQQFKRHAVRQSYCQKQEAYANTQEHDCSRGDVLCLIHRLTETPAVANITEYNEGIRIFRNVWTLLHTPEDSEICNNKRVNLKTHLFALVLIRSGQTSKQNAVKQQLCLRDAETATYLVNPLKTNFMNKYLGLGHK